MTEDALLEGFLNRKVRVQFAPGMLGPESNPYTEGKLYDYSPSGILLEKPDGSLDFVPTSAIRLVEIRPRAGWWERFTGTE